MVPERAAGGGDYERFDVALINPLHNLEESRVLAVHWNQSPRTLPQQSSHYPPGHDETLLVGKSEGLVLFKRLDSRFKADASRHGIDYDIGVHADKLLNPLHTHEQSFLRKLYARSHMRVVDAGKVGLESLYLDV
ncbi:MAG: hypothetical protein A4E58_01515 [Syntrophorhabdus sp. PtaB.Bin006]|nr:MAG: hypothetical protein A4E58_01515 [Syntrophorhabdus sp. PtaB.Bin006]